jgi:hypothetical protein
MLFNATFNNISVISWRSVLLVEETGVPAENIHRSSPTHWQTLLIFESTTRNLISTFMQETLRHNLDRGRRGRMIVGIITIDTISAYHHYSCEFESRSWRGVLDTTLCNKVCQWVGEDRWIFSAGTPVSSTNKTDRHDITEILLKVALNSTQVNDLLVLECRNIKFLSWRYN